MPIFARVLLGPMLVLLKEVRVGFSHPVTGVALISVGGIVRDLGSQQVLLILVSGRGGHLRRGLVPLEDTLELIPVLDGEKVLFNVPIVRALA